MSLFDNLPFAEREPVIAALATRAMDLYDLPPPFSFTLANISENTTYRVECGDGRCFALRIHRDGYHSREAIASELSWAAALRLDHVVPTPVAVQGRNGEFIQQVSHERLPRPRHVVLFEWMAGSEPGIQDDLRKPFEQLGEIAARMHLHSRQWQRPAWFSRFTWNFETSLGESNPHWGRWKNGLGVDTRIEAVFARTVRVIGQRLAVYGSEPDKFGLIHGDLRLSNLLVDGGTVKVIDFDDMGFGWFMYDAATPVSFHEHEPQVPDLIEHWKTGYRRVTPLAFDDEHEIPTFVMLRRLLLVAWLGSHSEIDLAKSLGVAYTEGTVKLCEDYLRARG